MKRVLLVSMPFASVRYPSAALSQLKALLCERSIPCDVAYLNVLFQAFTNLPNIYEGIADLIMVGERVFGGVLFGNQWSQSDRGRLETIDSPLLPEQRHRKGILDGLAALSALAGPFTQKCLDTLPWNQYDIIGFTSVYSQQVASLALARQVKERWPDKIIAFGGANCYEEMGRALLRLFPFVDWVFNGQADLSFPPLELCRAAGNLLGSANVLSQMGLIQHEAKNQAEAERLYQEALQGFQQLEEREGEANLLANLGTLYYETERMDEACQAYEKALALLRAMQHALGISGVLQNISYVYENQQKYSEASACLREARQICSHYEMSRDVEIIDLRLEGMNKLAEASLQRMRKELFPGLSSDIVKSEKKKGTAGRNDPCPCGSGKKYKKCCGA